MTRITFLPVCSIFPFVLYFGWTRFGCIERISEKLPKCLFSFALRKGKTWSFSLPVGATGIFKRPLRGLKTAKTPAWVKNLPKREARKFRSSLFKGFVGVQRAKPSVDHRNDRNSYTQCALHGVRGRSARESAPLKHSRYGNFFFLDNILGSAARNNWNRETLEVVKKVPRRFRVQTKDSVLLKPAIL